MCCGHICRVTGKKLKCTKLCSASLKTDASKTFFTKYQKFIFVRTAKIVTYTIFCLADYLISLPA